MSIVDARPTHKVGAMTFIDDTDDDDEWIGFTLMLGQLMRMALAVFVPSIALIAYLYLV